MADDGLQGTQQQAGAMTIDEPPDTESSKPRLLLIDDEPTIRSALSRFFSRRGWLVSEADNGAAALALLRATSEDGVEFDVIVSDLKMPGFSGIELHDQLARERPEALRRLIFSSGDVASQDAAAFVSRTTCPVLQKPFELSVLAEVVERVRAG